jgi:ribonuclease P/MRP protein subunit POP5
MVRLKNRYLLISIVYPSGPPEGVKSASTADKGKVNDILNFHAPSPDALHAGALAKAVREEVGRLFGDYGAGAIASSLAGVSPFLNAP